MKRRPILLASVTGTVLLLALVGGQQKPSLLVLDWAGKAPAEKTTVAVLIEMGLKDTKPTPWSGRVTVRGAALVHREGYRFGAADKLVEPDGWKASSRRSGQGQRGLPARAVATMASVGVVLHLTDVKPDAALVLHAGENAPVTVPLADVLAGQGQPVWEGKAAVRRVATATPVVTATTDDDFPSAAYGPDGTVWLAYVSYTLKEEKRRLPVNQIPEQPKDFRSYYTPGFGDQLFIKDYRQGKWGAPLAVTGANEDLARCAVGAEGNGRVWVVYSANRQGNYDLYARSIDGGASTPTLGPEQRLTKNAGPDITPVVCTSQQGHLYLAYQSWGEGGSARIALAVCRDHQWTDGPTLPGSARGHNRWHPALAAGPDGKVAVAYDVYQDGDYDVHVAVIDGDRVNDQPVATSPRFEARPSVAYDGKGRLWVAYEEGPEQWGKNFGALETDRGNPLYSRRTVRVACLEDGQLSAPAAELPRLEQGRRPRAPATPHDGYPKLGLDGKGRLWLTYRHRIPSPRPPAPGTTWLTEARRLDGDHWTAPLEVHHSDGLLDSRPALLPHPGGGLLVFANTDGRRATPGVLDNQIYAAVVDLPGEPAEPKLAAQSAAERQPNAAQERERQAVARMRDYRLDSGGKKYRLLRGDFHRHTEISGDGGNDGSLEDMFRYAIDAAALDWIANTDHDSGGGREYSWWLIQKFSDAYHVPGGFTPLFGYERSTPYPHGHRNCIFAKRGVRTLPRLAEPDEDKRVAGVHADDAKMLYRYLKELDGICASHTSATNMGTDWRDNDPQVEPVVEIYQGDRNNYEKEGAPRAGYSPESGRLPVNIAGWYPKGYINLALQKGYRLGFQSSSDHISTHISYCVALAEQDGREGIIAALKKRHSYAATDDILLEVRSGNHVMGDEFKSSEAPSFSVRAVGVRGIAQVDVLKDSDVVATFKPGRQEYQGTWTDPKPTNGVHYYYVRVEQEDGELAWSSPMWVGYGR